MRKQSPAKTNRQFVPEDKKVRDSVPEEHKKSQALSNEADHLIDRPAAVGFAVEDEDWNSLEYDRRRLKKVLGIDHEDFCEEILYQLYGLTAKGECGDATFNFVLSVLEDVKPVDKLHTMHVVQMAVCHLCTMKQAQILLKPVRFELPADFQLAMHNARYDTSRLDKQKIKIDDQLVRQVGERMLTRLMQTFALQLQTSAAYRKAAEPSVKAQRASATTGARITRRSKQQMNSIHVQKSNGHTPT